MSHYIPDKKQIETGWLDISVEKYRSYFFPFVGSDGLVSIAEIKITKPKKLLITRKFGRDTHRVVYEKDGIPHSMYVPAGWIAIEWTGKDGSDGTIM